jgi:glycosyltransferase involved in cell wall biosynthesis
LFTGRVTDDEKMAALRDADVFVLPSYTEAFGIALLEAMASELPVVVTDRAALAAALRDADAGVVVKSDAGSLSEALVLLLGDADRRSELGRRARHLVESRFSWTESAQRFAKLYEAVIARDPVQKMVFSV